MSTSSNCFGTPVDFPLPALLGSLEAIGGAVTADSRMRGQFLDSKAKTEYNGALTSCGRIGNRRSGLTISTVLPEPASELDAIAEQLAAAVGLEPGSSVLV